MNPKHVCYRFTVLAIVVVGLAPTIWAQDAGNASPTQEQRLARLCEQLEQQRETLHIPGMAIAVVKDDKIILSRGFGSRNLQENLPATDDTLFAIGSSTKAFTATLIGMMIDEGKMTWEDPVRKHLPDFRLSDPKADEQVVIRDLLCHRIGLASTDMLWYSGKASRTEILQTIAKAELLDPFRSQFKYNNVMFLAAGEAVAKAAGSNWDDLIAKRFFGPLGMKHSNTHYEQAQADPMLSKGYDWDDEKSDYILKPMRNLSNIAPAGAINSTVKDMAQWVRLQLGHGEINGKRLVSRERLDETWSPQITVAGDVKYGLGWMLHKWSGRRLVEHGGNIDGFGAQVALLPDDGVGFVLLTNVSATPLQQLSISLVFDALLGTWNETDTPLDMTEVQPYLGKYHFEPLKSEVTVLIQNGKLAVDVPGQIIYELKPPDKDGKRYFAVTDQIAASFERDANGKVNVMKMYQSGLEFELPREGYTFPIELTQDEAAKYLGTYHSEVLKMDPKVLLRNGRLAIDVPKQMIYDLHLPDADGKWAFRAKKSITVKFNHDEQDKVNSLTMFQDGNVFEMKRTAAEAESTLPSLDEILALQMNGNGTKHLSAIQTIRMRGTVRFVHLGISGSITMTAAGMGHYIQTLDFGKFGSITSALDGDVAWSDSTFAKAEKLTGDLFEQCRRLHPLILAADWRDFFNNMKVLDLETSNGKRLYKLDLVIGKNVRSATYLDAETGLVAREELAMGHKAAGSVKTTIAYDEYRDVEGVHVPVKFSVSNEFNGRMEGLIDTIETNIDLPKDTFTFPTQHKQ